MEHISEQSLAVAIERCHNIDGYRVLIVTKTWQIADYWSLYIADKYSSVFQGIRAITKNKFRTSNGSEIRLISQSRNSCGYRVDLILYDYGIDYDAFVALEYIESRPARFKLKHIMEEQINDAL